MSAGVFQCREDYKETHENKHNSKETKNVKEYKGGVGGQVNVTCGNIQKRSMKTNLARD